MKRPIVSKDSLDLQSNHFLRRSPDYPLGASFGELDYLRGWKDDFLGDALHEQYTTSIVGANSIVATLWDNAHGGWANLQSGDGNARYSRLWLGDAADGYDTLDADEGFVLIARMRINAIGAGNFNAIMGTSDAAFTRVIEVGINIWQHAANWMIFCVDAGGNSTTNTGVAFDSDWHVHIAEVGPTATGRQVDYWLDGSLIGSQTTNIDTSPRTGVIQSYSGGAVIRNMDVDYWIVIPRNL